MRKWSPEEAYAFLAAGTRTAKVATVRADGRPHVAPVWFTLDGATLVFTIWHTTVKAANIRRDPRICLCIDDDQPPFSYVMIEGQATLSDDLDARRTWPPASQAATWAQSRPPPTGSATACRASCWCA